MNIFGLITIDHLVIDRYLSRTYSSATDFNLLSDNKLDDHVYICKQLIKYPRFIIKK